MTDRTNTCATCAHHVAEASQCRRNPPAVQLVPVPVRTLQGDGMQLQPFSAWPPVQPDQWCGEWSSVLGRFVSRIR